MSRLTNDTDAVNNALAQTATQLISSVLMVLGAACFFIALYRELRRTRGNTIDDVVSQSRL